MNKQQEPRLRFKGFTGAWEYKKFENVLSIKSGMSQKEIEVSDGIYPILATGGEIGRTNTALYNKESVLIGRKGTIDKPYYMNTPFWTVDTLFYSELKNNIDGKFLYFLFQCIEWRKLDTSTGVPSLTSTTIHEIQRYFPSKPEQTHLGLFFRRLDSQIAESRAVLEKSRQLKKAMLAKMFPANGEKIPKIRFKGFEGEWECRKLGDLMNVTSVKRIHQSDWTNEGVRFLRARDIVAFNKGEKIEEPLFISKEKYNEYSEISGKVKIGDLLVTGVGTIGVPYLIEDENPLYFKDGNVIWFQNENKIGGLFFYYSFLNNFIQDFIIETAGIGTVGTYTIDTGKKTPIFLPPTESEQTAIGNFFRQLDENIALQSAEVEKLNQLKKGLLAAMLV